MPGFRPRLLRSFIRLMCPYVFIVNLTVAYNGCNCYSSTSLPVIYYLEAMPPMN